MINIQHCQFQVGSFNYDVNKMVFKNEFVADSSVVRYVISFHFKSIGMSYFPHAFECL